jgi:hypothetical protein
MVLTRPTLLLSVAGMLPIMGCGGRALIEAPRVYQAADLPLFVDLAPEPQAATIQILYATDRALEKMESPQRFLHVFSSAQFFCAHPRP